MTRVMLLCMPRGLNTVIGLCCSTSAELLALIITVACT